MPKIRLSALATDIKGKSGGSVFSSNKGGTYFRNNPAGGGRNSAKWNEQKGKFGSLAGQWRSLTDEEKTAWENMTANYPTTNDFGEQVIPSGFQLFMRLNGNRVAQDEPILKTPLLPRSVNGTGAITINTPDLFQFNPVSWTNLTNGPTADDNYRVDVDFPVSGQVDSQPFTIAINANIGNAPSPSVVDSQRFSIIGNDDPENNHIAIFVDFDQIKGWLLHFRIGTADNNFINTFALPGDPRRQSWRYIFTNAFAPAHQMKAYVNGNELVGEGITTNGTPTGVYTALQYIGTSVDDSFLMGQVSDFSYFDSLLNTDQIQNLNLGYVIGNEVIHLGFENQTVPIAKNYGSGGEANDGVIPSYPGEDIIVYPRTTFNFPKIEVQTANQGTEDTSVVIQLSKPTSGGRSGSNQQYQFVSKQDFGGNSTFPITNDAKALTGNNPGPATYWVNVLVLDDLTGKKEDDDKKGDDVVKFKAGSELSSSVN